jgi:hypothetical protein
LIKNYFGKLAYNKVYVKHSDIEKWVNKKLSLSISEYGQLFCLTLYFFHCFSAARCNHFSRCKFSG